MELYIISQIQTKRLDNMTLTLTLHDRDYTSWSFHDQDTNIEYPIQSIPSVNPLQEKLLHGDRITIDNNGRINDCVSAIKDSNASIPGILILDGNKTYGRTPNKKRLYYKCIPFDTKLPIFLVPYNLSIGFSKTIANKYVLFTYDNWKNTHPHGTLSETIGNVDTVSAFCEYQLHCNSQTHSIKQFNRAIQQIIYDNTEDACVDRILQNKRFNIEDRTHEYVFSIDPQNSVDFDDAFSIQSYLNDPTLFRVSIYIANVYVWLEEFDLWDQLTDRVSTIYLPNQKYPMIPPIMSDHLCSLHKKTKRFALCMDVVVNQDGEVIYDIPFQYKNVMISVCNNFVYEEKRMQENIHYKRMYDITQKMDNTITDSHDLVAFWMIFMNSHTGSLMKQNKIGIFRTVNYISPHKTVAQSFNQSTLQFLQSWKNTSGQYTVYNENRELTHDMMNKDAYIHITSPIRRVIDLINQTIIMKHLHLISHTSENSLQYINTQLTNMDNININMKSIRKIQNDCSLLHQFTIDNNIVDREFNGIIIEKEMVENKQFNYTVYIEEYKLISHVITSYDVDIHTRVPCKLFLFQDEYKLNKKIQLQLLLE